MESVNSMSMRIQLKHWEELVSDGEVVIDCTRPDGVMLGRYFSAKCAAAVVDGAVLVHMDLVEDLDLVLTDLLEHLDYLKEASA